MSGPTDANRKDRASHKPKPKRPKTEDEKKPDGAKCEWWLCKLFVFTDGSLPSVCLFVHL